MLLLVEACVKVLQAYRCQDADLQKMFCLAVVMIRTPEILFLQTLVTDVPVPVVVFFFLPPQPQEFFNVSVNIRMTAVKLEGGGLWVHAPVAPTEECVRLVTELGEEVRYIVLPTTAVSNQNLLPCARIALAVVMVVMTTVSV